MIGCRDMAGRRQHLIVVADHGRVVLVSPAGETAVLTPAEVGYLRAALRETLVEALHEACG